MADSLPRTLAGLRKAEAECTRCPLYQFATQVVPGEGPETCAPDDGGRNSRETTKTLAGHPFVGPAGRMLDRAITEAGLDRKAIFVTNAVKHFKFEQRGKRRLHKTPHAYEIDRCKMVERHRARAGEAQARRGAGRNRSAQA